MCVVFISLWNLIILPNHKQRTDFLGEFDRIKKEELSKVANRSLRNVTGWPGMLSGSL